MNSQAPKEVLVFHARSLSNGVEMIALLEDGPPGLSREYGSPALKHGLKRVPLADDTKE
jgi:hypothetical protein